MLKRSLQGSPIKYVHPDDPALDTSDAETFKAAWLAFLDSGDLVALHAVTREGVEPTVFDIAPLTRKQFTRVLSMDAGIEQITEAVAYGVRAVHNFQVEGAPFLVQTTDTGDGKRLTGPSLDAIFDPSLFAALSGRITEISRLFPTKRLG